MSDIKRTKRNIAFLQRRHADFDCDYVKKLEGDPAALAWLEQFGREFYDGAPQPDLEQKKAANRRRYSAKQADAMRDAVRMGDSSCEDALEDNLTPEEILLLKEDLTLKVVK